MKLSEAILLGSTILTPKAGGQHFAEDQSGCALGMAAIARGCTFRPAYSFAEEDRRSLGTEGVWGDWVLNVVPRPCACWRFWIPRELRIKDTITHIFDYHIMRKRNWTLEQLVAWVQTVEPEEHNPAGKIDPALLEEISQRLAARHRQAVSQARTEEKEQEAAEDWQARVAAFAAKHNSAHSPGHTSRQRRRSTV
jgi:hypothetical protein